MKYNVGQVLYVLLNKETKICPVQVIEEITKKTLEGETTVYMVRLGKKGEPINLFDMDGQIFDSVDVLRTTMHERITRTVDMAISNTVKRAKEWYSFDKDAVMSSPMIPQKMDEVSNEILQNQEEAIITLPDGTVAKIRNPIPGL